MKNRNQKVIGPTWTAGLLKVWTIKKVRQDEIKQIMDFQEKQLKQISDN